ncbi:MAG: PAS domain S-box protein, partial [Spirochaetota bacterium]
MKIILLSIQISIILLLPWSMLLANQDKTYLVSGDSNYPPYEYNNDDGNPDGFNIDLVRAVAREMDIRISISLAPWSTARNNLENGHIDILAGMFYSAKRDREVDFSIPHTIVGHVIYIRNDTHAILSFRELAGKKVLCQEGDIIHDILLKQQHNATVIPVQSQVDALLLLSAGRYDCAIVGEQQGLYTTRKHKLDNIKITGAALKAGKYCMAVHEGNTTLLGTLNNGLRRIKQTGEYNNIYNKWFGRDNRITFKKVLPFVIIPFVILGITVLILVTFSIILRKRVQSRTRLLATQLMKTKEAQLEAAESRDFFQKILDSIASPVYFKNLDGKIQGFNRSFLELAGLNRDQVIGKTFKDLAPEYAQLIHDSDGELIKTRKSQVLEIDYPLSGNNESIHLLLNKSLFYDTKGNPEGIVGIITDITDLRDKEERIHLLSTAITYASSVIIVTDTNGTIQYVNPTFTSMTGYSSDEATGSDIRKILNSNYHTKDFFKNMWKTIRSGRVWKGEILNKKKDGTLFWENVSIAPVRSSTGEITNFISIQDDITRQKMYQENLLQSKNNFLNIITSSHDAIIVLNSAGEVQYINPAAENLFGDSVENMLQEPLPVHLNENQEEISLSLPDGSIRYFELTFIPSRWQGENAKVAILHDITRDREIAEQVRRSLEEKNVLLKEIHHRVKNNMQLISSMLHLQAGYRKDDMMISVFRDIESRIRSMALIHEKLYQSKDYTHIELGEYIRDLALSLYNTYQADMDRIKLSTDIDVQHFDIDTAIPCGLILNELISNAIKHAFPDGREGVITVSLRNTDDEDIQLIVADNGIGISEESFLRRDQSLGMILVETLVKQLNGTLTFNTEEGTKFTILFSPPW